jgi:hypothetical protein
LTTRQKHLLGLCVAYLYEFIECAESNPSSDTIELYDFARTELFDACDKSKSNLLKTAQLVQSKLSLAIAGKETVANVLLLAVASMMVLRDEDVFKFHKKFKANRLVNSLYNKLEGELIGTDEFKNSMRVVIKIAEM